MNQLMLPFQRHSATSRAAAISMLPKAGTKRAIVLDCINMWGVYGLTDDEGMMALHMDGSTYRPRRRELEFAGLVKDSGRCRPTRSGQMAVVWVAT